MKFVFATILITISMTALAGNPDTIRACGNIPYTKNRDLNACIKSGAEADAVIACSKIGTMDMSLVNQCITSGASKEKIDSCAQSTNDINNFNACIKS